MPIPRTILDRSGVPDLDLRLTQGAWPDDLAGEVLISTSDLATAPRHMRSSVTASWRGCRSGPVPTAPPRGRSRGARRSSTRRRAGSASAGPTSSREERWEPAHRSAGPTPPTPAPLPWGDRLFTTWDAGRPVEVDPLTLGYLGDVGHLDDWTSRSARAGAARWCPSTAHPVIDPGPQRLWTVTLDPMRRHVDCPVLGRSGSRRALADHRCAGSPVGAHHHPDPGLADRGGLRLPVEPERGLRSASGRSRRPPTSAGVPDPQGRARRHRRGQPVGARAFRIGPEVSTTTRSTTTPTASPILFEHTHNSDLAMTCGPTTSTRSAARRPGARRHVQPPDDARRGHRAAFDPETGKVRERGPPAGARAVLRHAAQRPWTGAPRA